MVFRAVYSTIKQVVIFRGIKVLFRNEKRANVIALK